MHNHKGKNKKKIQKHTCSILGIDISEVHNKHLGHILNVLHNVEQLHTHNRELPENVLPAFTPRLPNDTSQQSTCSH